MGIRKLAVHVTVHDDDLVGWTFGPDDDLPDWAREKITNPDVWGDETDAPTPEPEEQDQPEESAEPTDGADSGAGPEAPKRPPRNGSRDTWVAYADGIGLELPDGMTRDDIIAAVDEVNEPPV